MSAVKIGKNKIELLLTQAMGSVRIADHYGNHVRRPSKDGKNERGNYVEWMITNAEVRELIKCYLDKKDCKFLGQKLKKICRYLKGSKFAVRKAAKTKLRETFIGFEIYRYKEDFYSFEKTLDSDIRIRLTFKMGDFTLAVHMFVLLPFSDVINIFNKKGRVADDDYLGSGAYATWSPNKKDVLSIIEGLAHASEDHRDNLLDML